MICGRKQRRRAQLEFESAAIAPYTGSNSPLSQRFKTVIRNIFYSYVQMEEDRWKLAFLAGLCIRAKTPAPSSRWSCLRLASEKRADSVVRSALATFARHSLFDLNVVDIIFSFLHDRSKVSVESIYAYMRVCGVSRRQADARVYEILHQPRRLLHYSRSYVSLDKVWILCTPHFTHDDVEPIHEAVVLHGYTSRLELEPTRHLKIQKVQTKKT